MDRQTLRFALGMIAICMCSHVALSQSPPKKSMDPSVFDMWKTIDDEQISNDGQWISYTLSPGEGDPLLICYNTKNQSQLTFERASKGVFDPSGQYLVFSLHPPQDSLDAMKRRKVDEKELPTDTLCIYEFSSTEITKIPHTESYKMPEKWDGYIAYQLSKLERSEKEEEDEEANEEKKSEGKKEKKLNKENGFPLVIRSLSEAKEDTFPYVTEYFFAKESPQIGMITTGDDSLLISGVNLLDLKTSSLRKVMEKEGTYKQLSLDDSGSMLSFLAHHDTAKQSISNFGLYYWNGTPNSTTLLADSTSSLMPEGWIVSEHMQPSFSEDETKLVFGIAPKPLVEDTTRLEDEIVNVEVWNYKDGRLYTQQEVRMEDEKKRAYAVIYHTDTEAFTPLASPEVPDVQFGDQKNAAYALGIDETPYLQEISWTGGARKNVYLLETESGTSTLIAEGVDSSPDPSFSPNAQYVYWYSRPDSLWMIYSIDNQTTYSLTDNEQVKVFDELNDRPMYARSYGSATWTENDQHILIYDRYDIWKIDPSSPQPATNLTNGRADRLRYRFISLNSEARFIAEDANILLHVFDEKTKQSGYARLNLAEGSLETIVMDDVYFSSRPLKAKEANVLVTTQESYRMFPDLVQTDTNFQQISRISEANPQQSEYYWGTNELYTWTSFDGQQLTGMLVKPEGFDPSKQYPLMVNFYEKSSDGLHRHRAPSPPRSSINYAYYNSKGFIIFNPDVPYRIGYPGESAYNSVVSGVTALIDEGFIDKERIGIQGHSWGGYQIAYLLTRTNLFACAEAGAPVVNMFSAYGGIRWGSGMSRMFQYEQTQSRIGGTIWEYPLRYIENSPLFTTDKIETPVLILHNDDDGAVPWYQGIEFFVALRRLGKPAWMLNYNGEPHGLTKRQNKKDFSLRMSQFFDHYLLDTPEPVWMNKGLTPLQKGIEQGLELVGEINEAGE